jgi:hypothetical protein
MLRDGQNTEKRKLVKVGKKLVTLSLLRECPATLVLCCFLAHNFVSQGNNVPVIQTPHFRISLAYSECMH